MRLGSSAWDLDAEKVGPATFFAALPELLPELTHLEIEGTRIAREVEALYAAYADGSRSLSERQTIFSIPASRRFRCRLVPDLALKLAGSARQLQPAAFADHLFLFQETQLLLEWHDAFANALRIAPEIPEPTVRAFAERLDVTFAR
jgi:hypothetical protein